MRFVLSGDGCSPTYTVELSDMSLQDCNIYKSVVLSKILLLCSLNFYRPQRSCGQGYVFTRVCDSVHRGGVVLQAGRTPPAGRPPPQTRQTPPQHQAHPHPQPPGPGRTPLDQAHPQSPGTRQNHPPGPGRPPLAGRPPPGTRQTPREADFRIRSMSGWYASYWNAFLFFCNFNTLQYPQQIILERG